MEIISKEWEEIYKYEKEEEIWMVKYICFLVKDYEGKTWKINKKDFEWRK